MLFCGFRLLRHKIRAMRHYGYAFSVEDALQNRQAMTEERGMASYDRSVISSSLLNPDWDDPTKFVFNPKFDLGVSDWLSSLPGDDSSRHVITDEDGQTNLVATPLSETVATISSEDTELGNKSPKHLQLRLPSAEDTEFSNNHPKRLQLSLLHKTQLPSVCPLKESTNHRREGENRFAT